MSITLQSLKRAHPLAVNRLARYMGLATLGRTTQDLIEELHLVFLYQS